MNKSLLTTAVLAATVSMSAACDRDHPREGIVSPYQWKAEDPTLSFTKLWTHGHTSPGQVSEIPAFDRRTNTIWVAGVVGVDVLNAATGALVTHIDVTPYGLVNSVAIRNGLAALAIEAVGDRRNPGTVLFYDTRTRTLAAGVNQVPVGSLPDMVTFTHDGKKLLVANEATPNVIADAPYTVPDPAGSVSIIDVTTRTVVATVELAGVPVSGDNVRLPASVGMDFEPEYIAVSEDGTRAFVTLQEGNALGVLDLTCNTFTQVIGLGAKDFSVVGNEIDPKDNDGAVTFAVRAAKGLYMPDGVATYRVRGEDYLVLANEGDFREDNADRSAASAFGGVTPLDRLRVSNRDSSVGNLFAVGGRSFSIRAADGTLVYDSGSLLDREAFARGIYDDGRSRDKGVEPEGVALLRADGRTYAFIGLERTTKSAVAVFDVTRPTAVRFLEMIVTDGDSAPEGLAVYQSRDDWYLAISNETVAPGAATSNTTVYRIDIAGDEGDDEHEGDDSDE